MNLLEMLEQLNSPDMPKEPKEQANINEQYWCGYDQAMQEWREYLSRVVMDELQIQSMFYCATCSTSADCDEVALTQQNILKVKDE
jgi:hypothetical protein